MRRRSRSASQKLSADSQRLAVFAQAIAQAASRVEERLWERNLEALLHKLLKATHQDAIDAALEHLFQTEIGGYEALLEALEAASEYYVLEQDGAQYDVLLIAAPILAWTRFSIASGPLAADVRITLAAHLQAHLLASDAKLALAPALFSIDQLPRNHAEALALTQQLALTALSGHTPRAPTKMAETAPFLADTRYLLAAVVAPAGTPLFRWQASLNPAEQEDALTQWRRQALPNIERLLPGCGIELLLPEAYYVACREADRQIRPVSIRAAVHYLTQTLNVEADDLQASVGGFGEAVPDQTQIDEYRIGFSLRSNPDVLYGVVWPLYGQEDEAPVSVMPDADDSTPIAEILALLRECGVTHLKRHHVHFPMEFCEDCGAPLYPDLKADLTHAEMPEEVMPESTHLH